MAEPDVLIHTFLDGETMMLRVIWHGQVLQFALSMAEITSMTATITAWQKHTMARIAEQWTAEAIVEQINHNERAELEVFRRQVEATEAEAVRHARAEREAEQRVHDRMIARLRREEDDRAT